MAIDNGKPFDWGRTSSDYAKYRDIYPQEFYEKIAQRGLCTDGQTVLDIGTGTGVIPRNMAKYGAKWTGVDISEGQIVQAKKLSGGTDIRFVTSSVEDMVFPDNTFDVVTACQCFFYFDHERVSKKLHGILKADGSLLVLYMAWLPHEDAIAGASESLVLKYNPSWSGAGATLHPIEIPKEYSESFRVVWRDEYKIPVHFTRETWHGRMKACRGTGASLTPQELKRWEAEHIAMLQENAPPEFDVRHYVAMAQLQKLV